MSLGALSLLTVCIPDINQGKEPWLSKIYVAILDALERQEGSDGLSWTKSSLSESSLKKSSPIESES